MKPAFLAKVVSFLRHSSDLLAAETNFISGPAGLTRQPATVDQQILKLTKTVQLMNHLIGYQRQQSKTQSKMPGRRPNDFNDRFSQLTEERVLNSANSCAQQQNEARFTSIERLDQEAWHAQTQVWPHPTPEQWNSVQAVAKRVCIMWQWLESKINSTAARATSSLLVFEILQLLSTLLEGKAFISAATLWELYFIAACQACCK